MPPGALKLMGEPAQTGEGAVNVAEGSVTTTGRVIVAVHPLQLDVTLSVTLYVPDAPTVSTGLAAAGFENEILPGPVALHAYAEIVQGDKTVDRLLSITLSQFTLDPKFAAMGTT